MKIYLAAAYARKEEMRQRRDELQAAGFTVVSSWLDEPEAADTKLHEVPEKQKAQYARNAICEMFAADALIVFGEQWWATVRGGHLFESGFAYAIQLYSQNQYRLVYVGPEQHLFHHLADTMRFEHWSEAKEWLERRRLQLREQRIKSAEHLSQMSLFNSAPSC